MTHLCGIGPFWDSINLQLFLGTIMVARDAIVNLVIFLLMYGVIKCGHHLMHLHLHNYGFQKDILKIGIYSYHG
jgi:hypothetical protein